MVTRQKVWCHRKTMFVTLCLVMSSVAGFTLVLDYMQAFALREKTYVHQVASNISNGHVFSSDYGRDPFRHIGRKFILNPENVPNNVFFVWCGRQRWFRYHNYVSLMSTVTNFRPDDVIFFHQHLPNMDGNFYNTWFRDFRESYPYVTVFPLAEEKEVGCDDDETPNLAFLWRRLVIHGGLYIGENVILTPDPPSWLMTSDIVWAVGDSMKNSLIVVQKNLGISTTDWQSALANTTLRIHRIQCKDASSGYSTEPGDVCVYKESNFSPESTWERDDDFGRMTRWATYGTKDVIRAKMTSSPPAPYIAHMVWISGRPMDYLFYLCVLSILHIGKFPKLYLHCDSPPSGQYWDLVKNDERIVIIHRNSIGRKIYNTYVRKIPHWSDAVRLEILIKYGGVYLDTDLLMVRPLERSLLNYDAVATYDFPDRPPFPNSLSCGFLIGKPHAEFWYLFQESMRWFIDKRWEFNGLLQPYKVMERHPGLVHTDRQLQVICYHGYCHPTWWPEHKNMSLHHLNHPEGFDWRQTNIVHICGKYPTAFMDEQSLLEADDIFGEMGRYVLRKAGLLKEPSD